MSVNKQVPKFAPILLILGDSCKKTTQPERGSAILSMKGKFGPYFSFYVFEG